MQDNQILLDQYNSLQIYIILSLLIGIIILSKIIRYLKSSDTYEETKNQSAEENKSNESSK